jgi:hypothetical protein
MHANPLTASGRASWRVTPFLAAREPVQQQHYWKRPIAHRWQRQQHRHIFAVRALEDELLLTEARHSQPTALLPHVQPLRPVVVERVG